MPCRPPIRVFRGRRAPAVPAGRTAVGLALLWLAAASPGRAEPVELSPQHLSLPIGAAAPLFADVEGNGRCALLVVDPVGHALLNYRQTPAGFSRAPDQIIPLPPRILWVAVGDVDPHPGLELVMSTAAGVVYSRQNDGRFETELRPLITAGQVFTNDDMPPLTLLATNPAGRIVIPLLSGGKIIRYQPDPAGGWRAVPDATPETNQTTWYMDHGGRSGAWALGSEPARRLRFWQSPQTDTNLPEDDNFENDAIRQIVTGMKKTAKGSAPRVEDVDVDGDGRKDVIVWQVVGDKDCRTDVYLFLRQADGQLPARPTEILHGHGFPLPFGPNSQWSPVHDLHGDGIVELVLLEFKTPFSEGGILDALVSHGLDWSLTIRCFRRGGFSHSPDASVAVTAFLPGEFLGGWAFCFQGDFNADGRPDLLVRRSDTQWNIYFSTTDGHWFTPQPALAFAVPPQGHLEIKDLNGDGRSDIIWHEPDPAGVDIFLSPSPATTDKKP